MLALTRAQALVLATGGALLLLAAGGALLLGRRRRAERAAALADIPRAMRPGPSDADVETPLLHRYQGWGVLLVVFFAVWIPGTWLFEPSRNLAQEEDLLTDSVERGSRAVGLFSEENQAGVGCVRCHGIELMGARLLDTASNTVVITPNLTTVCGGPWTGHPLIYSLRDLYAVIERGRGTLMPPWSIRYAGALDDQQINDIVNYVVSIQDESQVPFERNVCVNPEATKAAIGEFGPPGTPPANEP